MHGQATLNTLNAALATKADQFILLSAFCVRKPLLQFQHAKLKFEAALTAAGDKGDIKYSIVRPTAFFKSVSGQLELLQQGWPFVMFGDGTMCKCNPIAE
jgi:divinyl chlorophyllide a 8-vinyl-reductase